MRLQLLLKKDWRHPDGVRQAQDAVRAVGIQPTGAGVATLSGDASPDVFRQLFPSAAEGASATAGAAQALVVPKELEHCVESISIAPPHLQFD